MSKKVKIYVAGPYTYGDVENNVRKNLLVGSAFVDAGFEAYCPLLNHYQHVLKPRTHDEWVDHDIEWMGACDCLYRTRGRSLGADDEMYAMVQAYGRCCYLDVHSLLNGYELPDNRTLALEIARIEEEWEKRHAQWRRSDSGNS